MLDLSLKKCGMFMRQLLTAYCQLCILPSMLLLICIACKHADRFMRDRAMVTPA